MDVIVPLKAEGFIVLDIPDHWDLEDKEESIRDIAQSLLDRRVVTPRLKDYEVNHDCIIEAVPF